MPSRKGGEQYEERACRFFMRHHTIHQCDRKGESNEQVYDNEISFASQYYRGIFIRKRAGRRSCRMCRSGACLCRDHEPCGGGHYLSSRRNDMLKVNRVPDDTVASAGNSTLERLFRGYSGERPDLQYSAEVYGFLRS